MNIAALWLFVSGLVADVWHFIIGLFSSVWKLVAALFLAVLTHVIAIYLYKLLEKKAPDLPATIIRFAAFNVLRPMRVYPQKETCDQWMADIVYSDAPYSKKLKRAISTLRAAWRYNVDFLPVATVRKLPLPFRLGITGTRFWKNLWVNLNAIFTLDFGLIATVFVVANVLLFAALNFVENPRTLDQERMASNFNAVSPTKNLATAGDDLGGLEIDFVPIIVDPLIFKYVPSHDTFFEVLTINAVTGLINWTGTPVVYDLNTSVAGEKVVTLTYDAMGSRESKLNSTTDMLGRVSFVPVKNADHGINKGSVARRNGEIFAGQRTLDSASRVSNLARSRLVEKLRNNTTTRAQREPVANRTTGYVSRGFTLDFNRTAGGRATSAISGTPVVPKVNRLPDGNLLVTGGYNRWCKIEVVTSIPTCTTTPSLNTTIVSDGRVLVTGGYNADNAMIVDFNYDLSGNLVKIVEHDLNRPSDSLSELRRLFDESLALLAWFPRKELAHDGIFSDGGPPSAYISGDVNLLPSYDPSGNSLSYQWAFTSSRIGGTYAAVGDEIRRLVEQGNDVHRYDMPILADFDGDGWSDTVLYSTPSLAEPRITPGWYIWMSSALNDLRIEVAGVAVLAWMSFGWFGIRRRKEWKTLMSICRRKFTYLRDQCANLVNLEHYVVRAISTR